MKLSQITASSQDYLEAILKLSRNDSAVRSVDVANALQVSRASVNKAMGILKQMGLAVQEKYGTVSLTDEGKRIANSVKKRHHTLKGFLVDVLGVHEEAAEVEACKMEHVISPETLEKLENFIQAYEHK
ncbi:MAG: metal-dependent transcriptional regulator [Eubacteriales bacterium]|nr:metal-dependent transcriptional regulator [Eubacteriales bacterium]